MNSKVIIIGNDHTNTLGVIRALGENGIMPYVFIISDTKYVAIKKSKYIKEYYICQDENEAILTIENKFKKEKNKPVVIPTSDKAASILDKNYNRLKENFILHNINNEENQINFYMDKYNQYLLAKKYNIKIAESVFIEYPFNIENINFNFPVIIKPLASIDGKKEDINIATDLKKLKSEVLTLKKLGYQRLLIQELIEFDYECDMSGFSFNNQISISGYIKKERIWPQKRGSLTFGTVKSLDNMREKINSITSLLSKINYFGLFDIEFFIKGNEIYLNEINFRNSGLTYLYGSSYICYNYYKSCIKKEMCFAPEIKKDYYVMDEQAEIHQLLDKNITLSQHNHDKKISKILLAYNENDKVVSRYMLFYKVLNNLKLKKGLIFLEKCFHKSKLSSLLYTSNQNLNILSYNNDYEVIEINADNINLFQDNSKEILYNLKYAKAKAIVLKKDDELIGKGIIKKKKAKDRFVNISTDNSYLICNIFVNPKYRGKNYQCDIIKELIKFINCDNYKLYTVVYDYNIPSIKNFEKFGFKPITKWHIVRILKKSINKIRI